MYDFFKRKFLEKKFCLDSCFLYHQEVDSYGYCFELFRVVIIKVSWSDERSVRRLPVCINRGKRVPIVRKPVCVLAHSYGIIKG